jgi:hypothetical protein
MTQRSNMYPDPLVLTVAMVANNFVRIRQDGNVSWYSYDGNTAAKSETIRVLHSQGAKNPVEPMKRAQRHVITFGLTDYDASVPRTDQLTVSLTISDPNVSTVSRAEIDRQLDLLKAWLAGAGNMDRFLRGEL